MSIKYIVSRIEGAAILTIQINIQIEVNTYFFALIVFSICLAPSPSEKIITVKITGFINNGNVVGKKVSDRLDKQYYIDLAYKRLRDFGIENV